MPGGARRVICRFRSTLRRVSCTPCTTSRYPSPVSRCRGGTCPASCLAGFSRSAPGSGPGVPGPRAFVPGRSCSPRAHHSTLPHKVAFTLRFLGRKNQARGRMPGTAACPRPPGAAKDDRVEDHGHGVGVMPVETTVATTCPASTTSWTARSPGSTSRRAGHGTERGARRCRVSCRDRGHHDLPLQGHQQAVGGHGQGTGMVPTEDHDLPRFDDRQGLGGSQGWDREMPCRDHGRHDLLRFDDIVNRPGRPAILPGSGRRGRRRTCRGRRVRRRASTCRACPVSPLRGLGSWRWHWSRRNGSTSGRSGPDLWP